MRKSPSSAREFRRLAEGYLQQMVEEGAVFDSQKDDLVTSLVRQWLTYDGCATLFLGEQQVYLLLDRSPLGRLRILSELVPSPGLRGLAEEWNIDPQALPDVFEQLNRGQSADVTNDDGVPLRLWVNPRERSRGVEPPAKPRKPPGWAPNYRALAGHTLQPFSHGLEADELEILIDSVARQWQRYEGHACLFFQRAVFAFVLTKSEDGCQVATHEAESGLEAALASYDIPPEDVPEMTARINLGQEIEFRNREGIVCRLWHDPKTRELRCTPSPPHLGVSGGSPPIFCPQCGAILSLWGEGQRQQRCPLCGRTVARG